jgi:hypothetical protein
LRFQAQPGTAFHWRLKNSPLYRKIATIPLTQNDIESTSTTTIGSQVKRGPGRPKKIEE